MNRQRARGLNKAEAFILVSPALPGRDFDLYSFVFRVGGGHLLVRIRQQLLLLPSGGSPGCRRRSNDIPEPHRRLECPGLLQTRLTQLTAAQHQPAAAPPGCQRTLRPQGSTDWPVRGQRGPGPPVRRGPNSRGRQPGLHLPRDPGAEARVRWTVAKSSEALQGSQVRDVCKEPGHSEDE